MSFPRITSPSDTYRNCRIPALDLPGNRARLPAALAAAVDCTGLAPGDRLPGTGDQNLFVFDDGLILVVSRERHPAGEYLHASGVIVDGSLAHEAAKLHADAWTGGLQLVRQRAAELTGVPAAALALTAVWSEWRIPHFMAPYRPEGGPITATDDPPYCEARR